MNGEWLLWGGIIMHWLRLPVTLSSVQSVSTFLRNREVIATGASSEYFTKNWWSWWASPRPSVSQAGWLAGWLVLLVSHEVKVTWINGEKNLLSPRRQPFFYTQYCVYALHELLSYLASSCKSRSEKGLYFHFFFFSSVLDNGLSACSKNKWKCVCIFA